MHSDNVTSHVIRNSDAGLTAHQSERYCAKCPSKTQFKVNGTGKSPVWCSFVNYHSQSYTKEPALQLWDLGLMACTLEPTLDLLSKSRTWKRGLEFCPGYSNTHWKALSLRLECEGEGSKSQGNTYTL